MKLSTTKLLGILLVPHEETNEETNEVFDRIRATSATPTTWEELRSMFVRTEAVPRFITITGDYHR